MARKFTFRLDSEGVAELQKQLTALGSEGEKAFAKIQQASPQLANPLTLANEKAGEARQKLLLLGQAAGEGGNRIETFARLTRAGAVAATEFGLGLKSGENAVKQLLLTAGSFVGFIGGPWGVALTAGAAVLGAVVANLDLFSKNADDAKGKTESLTESQRILSGAIDDTGDALDRINAKLKSFAAIAISSQQELVNTELAGAGSRLGGLRESLAAILQRPPARGQTRRSDEEASEIARLQQEIKATETEVRRLAQRSIELANAFQASVAATAAIEDNMRSTTTETRRSREETRRLAEEEARAARAADDRFERVMRGRIQFSRALTRMTVEEAETGARAMRDSYGRAFADIGRIGQDIFGALFSGSITNIGGALQAISGVLGQVASAGSGVGASPGFSLAGVDGLSLGRYLFGFNIAGPGGPAGGGYQPGLLGSSPFLSGFAGPALGALLPLLSQGFTPQAGISAGLGVAGSALGAIPAIAGALGSFAPFLGPIGSLVGQLIGGLIGQPNNYPKAAGYLGTSGGLINLAGTGADNPGGGGLVGQAKSLTETAIAQINAIAASLGGSFGSGGLGYAGPGGIGGFQVKAGTFNTVVGGKVESFGQDQAAAIQNFIVEVIAQSVRGGLLAGVSGNVVKALGGTTDYDTLAELTRDINLGRLADGLGALSENALAFQAELIKLQGEFEATKKRAAELGFAIEGDLKKQFDASKQAIEEKYFGQFRQFAAGLQLGPLSVLSPQAQFEQAQTTYQDLQQRALAGDALAQSQFIGAAQTYLTLARQQFASSPAYVDIFNQVLASTQRLGSPDMMAPVVGAVQASGAAIVAAVNEVARRVDGLAREIGLTRGLAVAAGRG